MARIRRRPVGMRRASNMRFGGTLTAPTGRGLRVNISDYARRRRPTRRWSKR